MGSYCNFNPRLFKEFTSMKTKIKPALSDDWEIIPNTYNTNSGMMLYSEKLNQKVADIELRRFLQFSKEQNLTIQGLKLQGTYVIGNDRSVYTEEMFQKWKNKFELRTENIIDKKDYKIGHKYKTPCGAEYIYLGTRYKANIKRGATSFTEDNISKVTKKYYVCEVGVSKSQVLSDPTWKISELKQKFTKDLGEVINEETADLYLEALKAKDLTIVCLEKEKPKKPKFGLVELTEEDKNLAKETYRSYSITRCLVAEKDNKFYSPRYDTLSIDNGKINERGLRTFNDKTLISGREVSSYYSKDKDIEIDKMYRIGLID